MSKFLDKKYRSLVPYVPGEQPKTDYIKLNTNESPFSPSEKSISAAEKELSRLNLYPDPECLSLRKKYAEVLGRGITEKEIFVGNGSDEVLYLAFNAFGERGFVFPDISYGFYPVYAQISGSAYREIPLKSDYTLDLEKLIRAEENVVIANPNAPTGIAITKANIINLVESKKDRLVVVDEAYVDFGGESCVDLIGKYNNLLVTHTFSKSRSLAGARLGFGVANKEIIDDLNLLKYSVNPYNINRVTLAMGIGVLEDEEYTKENCRKIMDNREFTREQLTEMGFNVLPSQSNFLFASHKEISGKAVYTYLRERGILVRYFDKDRLRDFVRITIGSREQMKKLTAVVKKMTEEL